MSSWYRDVMDPEKNPLANLPPAQRFQVMTVLSVMWTTIFSASLGAWMVYGQLVVAHILVLIGILITGVAFRSGDRVKATYRNDTRKHDATRHRNVSSG